MKKNFQLCILIFGCASGFATETPPAILVNGITTILGGVRVLFKADDDAGNNFMLAIGEERAGIRLLDVEVQKGVVQFENHGVLQKISICPTPELVWVPQKSAAEKISAHAPVTVEALSGNENNPAQTNAMLASTANLVSGFIKSPTGSQLDPAANVSDNKPAGTAQNSWWYRAAAQLEAARLATAESVREGEHPAYPLTPLTPPGMAADLIGDGQLYFNHFQHFIGPGLVVQ